ncbi:AAA family ATPase [Pseudomonas sp. RIT-PI-S]|uniref:AAA family ATPase n=1 Tax=Pseudomonas sp. RIT-PI-S TaxID=3035295 RepID=UPI0021DB35AA|nr:AAA family ATPase [Pseudomonas sp. RIT-PI-S]
MLMVFSGLPGTGKTTLARQLALDLGALYLRIDTIEQAIRNSGALAGDVGRSGYFVANELASNNLRLGNTVVVDGVNPVTASRQAWCDVAERSGASLMNVQVVCSDAREHQRRVEARAGDIAGLVPPDWGSVLNHEYEPWSTPPFTVDTASASAQEAVAMILRKVKTF